MSRIFVCLFGLFILSIAVRFGDCENNSQLDPCNDENIKLGSDEVRLSLLEKTLMAPKSLWDKIWGKYNSQFKKLGSFGKINNDEEIKNLAQLLSPGTKWCGDGNNAKDDDDLGRLKETDACCRAHDNCESNILAGETLINLVNNGIFTKSHCDCDSEFHSCLKNVNGIVAFAIGRTYFNKLQPQCFDCACLTDCDSENKDSCKSCKKYEWKDNPSY